MDFNQVIQIQLHINGHAVLNNILITLGLNLKSGCSEGTWYSFSLFSKTAVKQNIGIVLTILTKHNQSLTTKLSHEQKKSGKLIQFEAVFEVLTKYIFIIIYINL